VVAQLGAPLTLYDDPDNLFVASFIGSPSMNMFDGRYEQRGGSACVRVCDLALPAPLVNAVGQQAVVYGVRPEHLRIAGGGIPFALDVIEPTGAATELFGTIAGQPCCVLLNGRPDVRSGATVALQADLDKVMVFDRLGSRRLR
jgi:multiple sugar transport system ATP-binding protein